MVKLNFDELGVCYKCALRLSNVTDARLYAEYSIDELTTGWCPLCFGLLQGRMPLDMKKMLEEYVSEGGFTDDGLCVCFALPCALSVREAAFQTKWLKSEDAIDNMRTTVVNLKQAVRWAIGLPSESSSICGGLRAQVTVTCPDADAQVANMLGVKQCTSRKRKKGRGGPRGLHPGELSKHSVERKLLDIRGTDTLARAADEWFGGGCDGGSVMRLNIHTRIHVERDPILVTGRYRKLSRCMPQSPWIINNKRKGEWSVHEVVAEPFEQLAEARGAKFAGAGREDIDVRMLGKGRPFLLELLQCRKAAKEIEEALPQLKSMVNSAHGKNISGAVTVSDLEITSRRACEGFQEGGEKKRKTYTCVNYTKESRSAADLSAMLEIGELEIHQQTPIRVMHRRSMAVRKKKIYYLKPYWINSHFFFLELQTAAGTYIKEFVHGDLGRTRPNVGELLQSRTDILQLDVIAASVATE